MLVRPSPASSHSKAAHKFLVSQATLLRSTNPLAAVCPAASPSHGVELRKAATAVLFVCAQVCEPKLKIPLAIVGRGTRFGQKGSPHILSLVKGAGGKRLDLSGDSSTYEEGFLQWWGH